jgi:carbon storage regulator
MLVLSRKEGEKIQIGDDIVLTITQMKGNRVTVGIEAPKDIAIRRNEIAFDSTSQHSTTMRHEETVSRVA